MPKVDLIPKLLDRSNLSLKLWPVRCTNGISMRPSHREVASTSMGKSRIAKPGPLKPAADLDAN